MDGRLIGTEDQASIITALKGFSSAYDNDRYNEVLEKILPVFKNRQSKYIFLDFGASGESKEVQTKLKLFEEAIECKKAVQISYVNALGENSTRIIEPVALSYRWYAWYLLAYCQMRRNYRIFKLARIGRPELTGTPFLIIHGDPADLLEQAFQGSERKCMDVTLLCKAEVKVQICEYLEGTITKTFENGNFIMHIHPIEDERMWFAMLMSFGDSIKVLEPQELKNRLKKTACEILSLYEKQ